MRPKERISTFIKLVNLDLLKERWNITTNLEKIFQTGDSIEEYWNENQDLRFGQMLINLNIIPDSFAAWIDEEYEILMAQGIAPEDCLYWTSYYDKEGNPLEKSVSKLICELDTEHILKIMELFYNRLDDVYKQAFNNELDKREEDSTIEYE
jgi:hypothetical protein